ncbi:MAG: hypothetical protein ACTSXJ_00065 [Candidatus Baldrarchaeia archaeon]
MTMKRMLITPATKEVELREIAALTELITEYVKKAMKCTDVYIVGRASNGKIIIRKNSVGVEVIKEGIK